MTDFTVGDQVKFAGGRGEITKLESLRREREEELYRLEEEKYVTLQEPELVTASYLVSPTEAKDE
jgi:hypothetical protein